MHKDKEHILTPPDFEMCLYFHPASSQDSWFQTAVELLGEPAIYSQGETIISEGDCNGGGFFYCVHGALEAVVKGEGGLQPNLHHHHHHHHLHGPDVPGDAMIPVKTPCMSICGRGSITGADRYFIGPSGIVYKARSKIVHGYHVRRRGGSEGPLQATEVDHLDVGVSPDKVLDFYEVKEIQEKGKEMYFALSEPVSESVGGGWQGERAGRGVRRRRISVDDLYAGHGIACGSATLAYPHRSRSDLGAPCSECSHYCPRRL